MWENNCNQTEYPCVKWLQSFCQYNKQSSAQVKLELHSGTFSIPEENKLQHAKLAWYVTSAYLTVSNMTLTEDGVTKALWKCVNYPALSGTLGPHVSGPSTRRKRHRSQRCSPPWEQVSLWAVSWCYKPSVHQKNTAYQANTLSRFNRRTYRNILNRHVTLAVCEDKLLPGSLNSDVLGATFMVTFLSNWSLTASSFTLFTYTEKHLV